MQARRFRPATTDRTVAEIRPRLERISERLRSDISKYFPYMTEKHRTFEIRREVLAGEKHDDNVHGAVVALWLGNALLMLRSYTLLTFIPEDIRSLKYAIDTAKKHAGLLPIHMINLIRTLPELTYEKAQSDVRFYSMSHFDILIRAVAYNDFTRDVYLSMEVSPPLVQYDLYEVVPVRMIPVDEDTRTAIVDYLKRVEMDPKNRSDAAESMFMSEIAKGAMQGARISTAKLSLPGFLLEA